MADVRPTGGVTSYSKTWVQVASTNYSSSCLTDTRATANRKPGLVRRGQDQCSQVEMLVIYNGAAIGTSDHWATCQAVKLWRGDWIVCFVVWYPARDVNMSMHLYQLSSRLLEETVGIVNDNLTSVVLAASAITLTLGYIFKILLKQSTQDKDLVSSYKKV